MDGDMLARSWQQQQQQHRTEESKARLLQQLRKMLAEMRDIPVPRNVVIGKVDRGVVV